MYKLMVLACCICFFVSAVVTATDKVILDTDMVEGFDDGVALMLLANSPEIELLGVTIVSGNSWVAEGTAHAIRQLEMAGREDVPVYMGMTRPFRPGRIENIVNERAAIGIGEDDYVGCMDRPEPADWRVIYRERYNREPSFAPEEMHAANFIIDTVRKNPGEVTVVAIGPLGNLALAVRMAPDIAPLIKKIVYMGGSFFQPGNVTPAAEFNWWFDPEAARIVVRSPFPEQVVFGLDVCEKVVFSRGHYNAVMETLADEEIGQLIRESYVGASFESDSDFSHYIWDVITAASLIEPSLILNHVERSIDVVDDFGPAYGQSLAYRSNGPRGAQKATIITDINKDRFWEMMLDKDYWLPKK